MAPWALTKLLHPFTPEDLLRSQRVVSALNLPPSTSQFVLALSDPHHSSGKVVYVLSVEKLSERSIGDVRRLVTAVNPSSVVAFVDTQYLTEIVEEGSLLESPKGLEVPTSYLDVIKNCFVEKIKASVFERRATLRVLINIFGTTFYGNVFAARKAAEETKAVFEYLRIPSVATSSFLSEEKEEEEEDEVVEDGGNSSSEAELETNLICKDGSSYASTRFLNAFSGLLGGNELEYLTHGDVSSQIQRVSSLSPSCSNFHCEELAALANSVASSSSPPPPAGRVKPISDSDTKNSLKNLSPTTAVNGKLGEEEKQLVDDGCPAFAAPFYPLFLDLHQLFTETPGVNQALGSARNVLNSVERGDGVELEDVSRARLFRVAVESVRMSWNSFVGKERGAVPPGRPEDFAQLPFEEKCHSLLAHALQCQAQKLGTVVAIVDASKVPGIRRHWNTPVPPEVAAYAEYCFVALNFEEIGQEGSGSAFNLLDKSETKAAVVVGAGAVAAAGMGSLPHWASVPTFMKMFSFKVPTALKVVWMQMKRSTIVSWATPTSKGLVPALKVGGLAPSSGTKAMLVKSVPSAEKARAAAHTLVGAVEKASLQAIRTAFYSLMRSRQAKNLGPRPWLVFGGSVVSAAAVLFYGDEVEHAISVLPSASSVVRLGRGLENLEQASGRVDDHEGSNWWNRVYETLYRNPHRF